MHYDVKLVDDVLDILYDTMHIFDKNRIRLKDVHIDKLNQ